MIEGVSKVYSAHFFLFFFVYSIQKEKTPIEFADSDYKFNSF